MAYRSDRQRVEAMLIPQMLLSVLLAGVNDLEHPDAVAAKHLLVEACDETVIGLLAQERSKIIRRMFRLHQEITGPYSKPGARVDKIGLIAYFLVKSITDREYMVVGADSALQKALDLMLPALEPAAGIGALLESARKQTRGVLDQLQSLGYYGGVPCSA